MQTATIIRSQDEIAVAPLSAHGLMSCKTIFLHLPPERLTELALTRGEGVLTDNGTLMCGTGKFTGRSPKDKFIVCDAVTKDKVNWGNVNIPFDPAAFEKLHIKMMQFLENRQVFVRYAYAGAEKKYRRPVMMVTTKAWHNLFCYNLFIRPERTELADFLPEWTVICVPEFSADPSTDGTRGENFTIIDFSRKTILVGGTGYAGEIKKGMFTVLNFLLPVEHDVLPMHCSANTGLEGAAPDTALFFGLSGTGKTTLSADAGRQLIGDDEHGWAPEGIFNLEGGCYAKVVNLSEEREPQIYKAIRPGAVLENTRFHPATATVDFTDITLTENTRTAYPLDYIPNACRVRVSAPPRHVFFLTADAFGVLPPLARLSREQAMFYFLAGYTSKLAGTEMGVNEPVATFSSCFGEAFLPLAPEVYARMLGRKLAAGGAQVWLVNTGWIGGPYGTGTRIPLPYTRALLKAVLDNSLSEARFIPHPVFGVEVPESCGDIPCEILHSEKAWADPAGYQRQAMKLLNSFLANASKFSGIPGLVKEKPTFAVV